MTEDEKYLFDINGYIVVRDALSAQDIDLANQAIDHHANEIQGSSATLTEGSKALEGSTTRGDLSGGLAWENPHGAPFRSMLTNAKVVPYLHEVLGEGFRLDHDLAIVTMQKGAEGFALHGGSSKSGFDPHQFYIFKDGRMHNGLTVAAYQLTDVDEGDGGFCVVPGSHKGNYTCPDSLRRFEQYREFVRPVPCKTGDCIIFTEAIVHGTLPWTSDRERRTALFRFSPGNLAYMPHAWSEGMLALMTDEQRKVLEPPYHTGLDRPVLGPGPA
jgi:hypothetical protein